VHILAVVLSGSLFALRGAFALAGARWPHAAGTRYLSYAIDTTLLTAALMLLTILPGAMFANGWLATKLALVVAYVVLGVLALRRGRTRGIRLGCFVAALLVFATIFGIARMHHPLGWLLPWLT
jgi:uncharacterized membrane protein SirB2